MAEAGLALLVELLMAVAVLAVQAALETLALMAQMELLVLVAVVAEAALGHQLRLTEVTAALAS